VPLLALRLPARLLPAVRLLALVLLLVHRGRVLRAQVEDHPQRGAPEVQIS
jgi:hypothetical protein